MLRAPVDRADALTPTEMNLEDYFAAIRRRKWFVVVPVVFALGFSIATSLSTTPMYRASADVLVQAAPTPGAVQSEVAMNQRTLNNELLRAEGTKLQEQARSRVGDEPTLTVKLAQDKDADLLMFSAESRQPQAAADAANAYAEAYVGSRRDELAGDLESQSDVLRRQLAKAQSALDNIIDRDSAAAGEQRQRIAEYRNDIDRVETAANLARQRGATVVNEARVPRQPFAPTPLRSGVLAVLIGLLVGLAAAFIRDLMDTNVRTPEQLEDATGLTVGAVVPRIKGRKNNDTYLAMLNASSSPQAESYRALRARLQFRRIDEPMRSILVTSPRPGDGKTTTAANLALAFASAGESTVLVDLDLRRPRVHTLFGTVTNEVGMADVLRQGVLDHSIQRLLDVPNLSVIAAGPPTGQSSELLTDVVLDTVFAQLLEVFDTVVVDSPPVLAVADPLTLGHYCDGVLLVVSASGTDRRDATVAAQQLNDVDSPMVGAVLNNYNARQAGYSYSYAYSTET